MDVNSCFFILASTDVIEYGVVVSFDLILYLFIPSQSSVFDLSFVILVVCSL
jgi:hypothetical protein